MIPLGHHGYGEEMLPALVASGGTLVAAALTVTRARLAGMMRWLRRR